MSPEMSMETSMEMTRTTRGTQPLTMIPPGAPHTFAKLGDCPMAGCPLPPPWAATGPVPTTSRSIS